MKVSEYVPCSGCSKCCLLCTPANPEQCIELHQVEAPSKLEVTNVAALQSINLLNRQLHRAGKQERGQHIVVHPI